MVSIEDAHVLSVAPSKPEVLSSTAKLITLVQKARQERGLQNAKLTYKRIRENGLDVNPSIGHHVISMFVDCGSLADAELAFDRLAVRTEYSWSSLMQGYLHLGDLHHVFKLYNLMVEDCIYPSKITFYALLKASAKLRSLDHGRHVHCEACLEALETDILVGNCLIDMYSKCDALLDAKEVFDTLPDRDTVTWNTLIAAFNDHGLHREALNHFDMMKLEGFIQNDVTFICGLKACRNLKLIDTGFEIHADVVREGYENVLSIANSLVDLYVRCGFILEASEVFRDLPERDVFSWNAFIAGYAEANKYDELLNYFEQMQKEGLQADVVTFVCILKACNNKGEIQKCQEIHSEVIRKGLEENLSIGNTLIDLYGKWDLLVDAKQVFDSLPGRDVVSWTALLTGYAERGLAFEAINGFKEMEIDGVSPNPTTFLAILRVVTGVRDLRNGHKVHIKVVKMGYDIDRYVANSLMDMYAKGDVLEEAISVFNQLSTKDVVSWNTIIAGNLEHGFAKEALRYVKEMRLTGICPDTTTFTFALKACGTLEDIAEGQELHLEIIKDELERDLFVGNTLVDMYAKCGWYVEAEDVFDHLAVQNAISWTALVSSYADNGLGEKVLDCMDEMLSNGIHPDGITFIAFFRGCAILGALETGRKMYASLTKCSFELLESDQNVLCIGNALIDMYGKCGNMTEAEEIFRRIESPDLVSWNTLITGYARHEKSELVLHFVQRMIRENLQLDELTFLNIISVCSHAGLIDECQNWFKIMSCEYDIVLTIGHYNCLVDLYGRAGQIDEAIEIVNNFPFQPNIVTWSTLLDACRKAGNVELSELTFESALGSQDADKAAFVLMSNIYAGLDED